MTRSIESGRDPHARASIEKAILADICLGYPLGRIVFGSLGRAPLPPGLKPPATYLFRGEQLAALKHGWRTGHEEAVAAVTALIDSAENIMGTPAPSVTDKPGSRFSEDPRDYQSLAKYYWPDEDPALPWVRHDGEVNPECYSDDFDYLRLVRLAEDVTLLGLAAYVTDRPEYGQRAAQMLHRWFLDPSTAQTPNFEFAQVAPCTPEHPFRGRWPGVVEARFLIYVTEAVRLIESSGFLPQSTGSGLRRWFGDLLDWMLESDLGGRASQSGNNIALWHGLQSMVYADFCGRGELAAACLRERVVPQLEHQISPDGSLPAELDRAYPQDYLAFSIAAMALISRAGEHHGATLWDQKRADGRNLQASHDWLLQAMQAPELLAHVERAAHQDDTGGLGHALDVALKMRATERALCALAEHTEVVEGERDRLAQANAALQRENEVLARAATELRREHDASRSELDRARRDFAHYAARLERLADALLASLSWRITRPFRTVLRLLKGGAPAESRQDFIPPRPASIEAPDSASPNAASVRTQARIAAEHGAQLVLGVRQVVGKLFGRTPEEHLANLRSARPADEDALKADYRALGLDRRADTFVLYRIIGNDLHPRHSKGQSYENLRVMLENEPPLADCERRWVVNRIVDPEEERRVIDLLGAHGQDYIHIPFVADEYLRIGLDFDALPSPDFLDSDEFGRLSREEQDRARVAAYRLKNLYVMNNNGARNIALRDGQQRAKWVLPWDGNCFVTADAWREIVADVTARPHLKYLAVPMERMLDNAELLRGDYRTNPVEEPQLLFRCDAAEAFNEDFPYGRRPKVELFWRLGIPGSWDEWRDDPWDQPRRPPSPEAGHFGCAGWVARMFSGQHEQEDPRGAGRRNRMLARRDAIVSTIDAIDAALSQPATEAR